jgi:hypothetical protein
VKGLYPGGGQNYYNHYFPAYQAFLEHGSIWPNEVWQLYFYVKGEGLFFLAMLLTDPLTQQLVVFCFLSAAGLATFLFIRRVAPNTHWPIVGVLRYTFTPPAGASSARSTTSTLRLSSQSCGWWSSRWMTPSATGRYGLLRPPRP